MDETFILTVIEKFNSTSVTELELDDSTTRLVLRKERVMISAENPLPMEKETEEEHSVRPGVAANAIAEVSSVGEKIKSPIVATFYSAPGPDAPPYVKPGSKVKAGQTLCILEAMKMMNHLEAEFDCEIVEVHVSSDDLVEYGQALFTVKRK
jgi:acetyl-CoA carboxylase biotin carboxyl carrier protein